MTGLGVRTLDLAKFYAARRLAVTARPYLAMAMHAMTVVACPQVLTAGVDRWWRCYAAPQFVAALEVGELAAVWLHEVSHLVRDHHSRAARLPRPLTGQDPSAREQLRQNAAMDCEINDDLLDGVPGGLGLRLPDGVLTPQLLGLPRGLLFEGYLRELPASALAGRMAWLDCGSGAHTGRPPWELGPHDAHPLGPYEAESVRWRVRQEIATASGTTPRGWRRWADQPGEATQDWRRLLAAAVRAGLATTGSADYSYRRPARRAAALDGVLLPSLNQPLPRVAVVIDTSASVLDQDLGAALSEVVGITAAVGASGNRLSVYSCDAAVHTAQQVCSADQVSLIGGGGTDLRRGMAAATGATPAPDVLVVLTDGQTPWPVQQPRGRVIAGLLGRPPRLQDDGTWHPPRPPGWVDTVQLSGGGSTPPP